MRIVELKSENIKRLKVAHLRFGEDERLVVVTGKNAQGKTSLLDSIWYALAGQDAIPSKPIREGEETATITLDLGEYVVERRFTEKNSYLAVITRDGAKYPSPQKFLDQFLGKHTFDPLLFARQDRRAQRQTLLDTMGVDVTELDTRRKTVFDERTAVGREVRATKTKLEEADKNAPEGDLPENMIDVADLGRRLADARDSESRQTARKDNIETLDELIRDGEKRLEDLRKQRENIQETMDQHVPNDVSALEQELDAASGTNDAIRARRAYRTAADVHFERLDEQENLTFELARIDAKKEQLLTDAGFPLEGLGLDDEGVTFRDIPFDQLSSAEQLRVSLATAMAANPDIRVVRITDGSLLDADNMEVIRSLAEDNDFQVWVERVDDSGEVGIYIEDGEVAADNR